MSGKKTTTEGEVGFSAIGEGSKFVGDFITEGDVAVNGEIQGNISTPGNVSVGPQGKILGQIIARNLSSAGTVRGNVKITEKLELASTANLHGNVETALLKIDEGAILQGKCNMSVETEKLSLPL